MKKQQKKLYNTPLFILIATCMLLSCSANFTGYSQQEIVDEISEVRNNHNVLRMAENTHHDVKYYLDRLAEDKILKATTGWGEYFKKYITMWTAAIPGTYFALLTKDNAPKTYTLIEEIAAKIGLTELPLIYLAEDETLFTAFVNGTLQSFSAIFLTERLLKELPNKEALEFVIAHELTHIKTRDVLKRIILGTITYHAASYLISYATQPCRNMILSDIPTGQEPSYLTSTNLHNLNQAETLASLLITALIATYYSRIGEYNADLGAISTLGTQGGFDCLTHLQQNFEPNIERDFDKLQAEIAQSELNSSSIFHLRVKFAKLWAYLGTVFSTHPTNAERIENIKSHTQN
jgi:Zn-dependent protease with chaperone function